MDNNYYSFIDSEEDIINISETMFDIIDSQFDIENSIIEEFGDAGKKLKKQSINSLKIINKNLFKDCLKKSKASKTKALDLYNRNKPEEAKRIMSNAIAEIDKYINKITENCNECIKILDDHGYSRQADKHEKIKNNYINKLEKQRDLLEENKRYVDMKSTINKKYDSVKKRPKELVRPKKEEEEVKESVLIDESDIDNKININFGIINYLIESKRYDDAKYILMDTICIYENNKNLVSNKSLKKNLLDYYNETVNENKLNIKNFKQDIYEEAVSLVKLSKKQIKLKEKYSSYVSISIDIKNGLYRLFNSIKNNNDMGSVINELDYMKTLINKMMDELKKIKIVDNDETYFLLTNQVLVDTYDVCYYFLILSKNYFNNENSDKIINSDMKMINNMINENRRFSMTHSKLDYTKENYDNFNDIVNVALSAYKNIIDTINYVNTGIERKELVFNIKDTPCLFDKLFESSASVVGSLLPQGCGYCDNFNPYTQTLPSAVVESMIDLDEHSNIYLEKLNDILNKKSKEKKINSKKIKDICALYNKQMIAKGNVDLIKTTNRDYKKDSNYIKNQRDYLLYSRQFKLKYRLLNYDEKEYVDSYIVKFDSSFKRRLNKNKKTVKKESADMYDNDYIVLNEGNNIDKEIANVIAILNAKGFKTKYSSAGHTQLRKKDDRDRDGVYYDKLYTDARIMFQDDFRFPTPPKHWKIKNVDGCDYLQPIPRRYNEKDGTPDEAFAKWKAEYMQTLRTWANNLPEKTETSKIIMKNGDIAESSKELFDDFNNDIYDEIFNEFMLDELD